MPERRVEYVPLAEIRAATRNAKKHDEAGIRSSINRFGLGELPLVDERTGQLVAGHGRLAQLADMHASGHAPPDGIGTTDGGDWLVPVVRGWASRSDAEAEAYLLASNRLTTKGGWDEDALAELLGELARTDIELAITAGWGADELEDLLAELDDGGPLTHETPPATEADYADTDDERADRAATIANYEARTPPGLTEMILVFTNEDRAEAGRLIAAAKESLGAELRASEVVLRALRALTVALDARHDVSPLGAELAKAAGWDGDQ